MNKTLIDVIKEGGAKDHFSYDPFSDHNYKAHLHAFLFYTLMSPYQENAKIADALGVDWSQLMSGQEMRSRDRVEGVARKNWSGPEIFR